ncbi:hypothetical protein AHAS_Ahas14G0268900 [Arachis hypogaea]
MASKYALVILGLLAMIALVPSKMTAARDFAVKEISKSNDNEAEGSGEIGGIKLEIPKGCRLCCQGKICYTCFCKKPPPSNNNNL